MTPVGDRDREERLHHGRAARIALTLLLLIHWGSVAVFLLPTTPDSIAELPGPIRVPVRAVVVPAAYRGWPLARHWLDATSTRQHWTLFAPDPADWSADLEATAYYLAGAPGEPVRFEERTLAIAGPADDPLPHWTEHRPYRNVFNLGFDDWGAFYRPLFARRLCLESVDGGRRPAGIALVAIWEPLDPPWAGSVRSTVRQRLGGWSCWELLDEPRPAALPPVPTGAPERPPGARG